MTLKLKESLWILLGITIIMLFGIFVLKMPVPIILLIESVFAGSIAISKGTSYSELQNLFISSVSTILTPAIIMLLIGALVASWIMSGTVPTLICLGLKIIDPKFFLVVSFVMCSATSMIIGTSWGTISTIGIAFMGISNALGLPPIYTVSTIVSGAIIGDKMSPLSSSMVLATQVTDTSLIDAIKSASRTNIPAFVVSLIMYAYIGFMNDDGLSSTKDHMELLDAIGNQFDIGLLQLMPPLILIILIMLKLPTIPAFLAGTFMGVIGAIFVQKANYVDVFQGLISGYTYGSDPVVNQLLNYGGINSMTTILTLLIFAAAFCGIIKHLGIISSILERIFLSSSSKFKTLTLTSVIHTLSFVITGNYYTTNAMLGPTFLSIFKKNDMKASNITAVFLDTGTGISPLIPWTPTCIFVANTLGFASMSYCIFSPVLWLPLLLYPIIGIILEKRKR